MLLLMVMMVMMGTADGSAWLSDNLGSYPLPATVKCDSRTTSHRKAFAG
jgi:hypothetical protein